MKRNVLQHIQNSNFKSSATREARTRSIQVDRLPELTVDTADSTESMPLSLKKADQMILKKLIDDKKRPKRNDVRLASTISQPLSTNLDVNPFMPVRVSNIDGEEPNSELSKESNGERTSSMASMKSPFKSR